MTTTTQPRINRAEEPARPGERWVKTVCNGCIANTCGMRVLVRNGMIVKAVGDPENPLSKGMLCAKSHAYVFGVHDPKRIRKPLKRTNPEKGIGVDPKWVEISYEEAYDTIARKMKEQRERDPSRMMINFMDFITNQWNGGVVANAWGAEYMRPMNQAYCGNAVHSQTHLKWTSFLVNPDFTYTKYLILMGTQKGANVQHYPVTAALERANAQQRGVKVVAIDPLGTNSTSKATEWVPILPGTDGALALAWMNILVNELRIFDVEFLSTYTNAPYLIKEDGHYVRDHATNKPMMWDEAAGAAKVYDDPSLGKPSLEGRYRVRVAGKVIEARTAFEAFKEELRHWPAERAAEITTAPAEAIRRIAKEFGEAANIGGTIVIDGEVLPYRPAGVHWHRGLSSHSNTFSTGMIIALINIIIGNVDVPGGMLGEQVYVNPPGLQQRSNLNGDGAGLKDIGDGILGPAGGPTLSRFGIPKHAAMKPKMDAEGRAIGGSYGGLFPMGRGMGASAHFGDILYPERHGKLFNAKTPETILMVFSSGVAINMMNPEDMMKLIMGAKFVGAVTSTMDEGAEQADIIVPSAHFLERLEPFCNAETNFTTGIGGDYNVWNFRVPVVETDIPHHWESWFELCDRLGMLPDNNQSLNVSMDLRGEYRLDPEKKYTWRQLMERFVKQRTGRSLDQVISEGQGHYKWKRTVKERYPRPYFKNARIPFYGEEILKAREELEEILKEIKIDWWDLRGYTAVPTWIPCKDMERRSKGEFKDYDLVTVTYKVPFVMAQHSLINPWVAEVANLHPYVFKIWMNADTAARKGLADGDLVQVESARNGKVVTAPLKVSECVHPGVIGIASHGGHWSKAFRDAAGKGVWVHIMYHSHETMDYMLGNADHCIPVKVTKAPQPQA